MRIAFYAPLKSPDHPVPSGDRRIGRLIQSALARNGHDVRLVSRFRSYDGAGNAARQATIRRRGEAEADRLVARFRRGRWAPQLWFTYHLYHKAPDWVGPRAAKALGIPYVVAEASYAPKRADGPWAGGHRAVAAALAAADRLFVLNANDLACTRPLLAKPERAVRLAPFVDSEPYRRAARERLRHRAGIARRHRIPPDEPWLLAVAMMRPGDKLASYRVLGQALKRVAFRPWRLLVVGSGAAEPEVRRALAPLGGRVTYLGAIDERRLPPYYAAADLFVWPAINEAIGMAILEAQAAGTPAVVGRSGAIAAIVAYDATGLVLPVGDVAAFAAGVAALLKDAAARRRMGVNALAKVAAQHDLDAAARALERALAATLDERA
jgi:glycosyltransferase involved in cell wall biosynthesis